MNIVKSRITVLLALCAAIILLASMSVSAANTPTLNQTINAGTLVTDILDTGRSPVALPSVAFGAKTFSFDCQFGGTASTSTLGTNGERLYVINPNAANGGWTLSIAATGGPTALWQNTGSTQNYDYNDVTGANPGCDDGADGDTRPGQITLNATPSAITTDCASCTSANIVKGGSVGLNQGVTDSYTLLTAAAATEDVWRGYLTGVGLSQTIPAEQAADSYTLQMTVSVVAN